MSTTPTFEKDSAQLEARDSARRAETASIFFIIFISLKYFKSESYDQTGVPKQSAAGPPFDLIVIRKGKWPGQIKSDREVRVGNPQTAAQGKLVFLKLLITNMFLRIQQ